MNHVLCELLAGLLHAVRHDKLTLLFAFPEGSPLRPYMVAKIAAMEKTAAALAATIKGAPAAGVVDGLSSIIAALDATAIKVSQEMLPGLYEERAWLLSLKDKFSRMDALLSEPEELDAIDTEMLN